MKRVRVRKRIRKPKELIFNWAGDIRKGFVIPDKSTPFILVKDRDGTVYPIRQNAII